MLNLTAIFSDPLFLQSVTCERVHYPANSVILHEGDEGSELYLITDGEVDITSNLRDEKHTMSAKLARLGRNDVFGELSMFDSFPRSAQVTAVTDCEILKVNGPDLIAYLDNHPAQGYFVILDLFMKLVIDIRQNNLRTNTVMQLYLNEHDDD